MGTGGREVRLAIGDVHVGVGIREAHAQAAGILGGYVGVQPGDVHLGDVGVDHSVAALVPHGGDAVVHQVEISGQGDVVAAFQVFGGEREVLAAFGLQVLVAVYHEDVRHVEVHVHFLQRGGAESAGVGGAERAVAPFVHDAEFRRGVLHVGFGIIVEADRRHHVEVADGVQVELGEGVGGVLLVVAVVGELVAHQVVAHEVASHGKGVLVVHRIVVEGAYGVLHVGIVAQVIVLRRVVVALVVLVEAVRQFQVAPLVEGIVAPEPSRKVAVAVLARCALVTFAEEVSQPSGQLQPVGRGIDEAFLEVPRAVAVHAAEVVLLAVLAHGAYFDGVGGGVLHVEAVLEVTCAEGEGASVTLVVVRAVLSVQVQCPRLGSFLGDEVDHSAHGVRAIE